MGHTQPKLPFVIADFDFNLVCLCVLECVAQCLPCNPADFTGAGAFRGESTSCDEARESTSLPYSRFVRSFPAFFHDI
jgi:hypothetical protein